MTGPTTAPGPGYPVDHVNVIDGDLTRRRTRVKSPFVVWSGAGDAGDVGNVGDRGDRGRA